MRETSLRDLHGFNYGCGIPIFEDKNLMDSVLVKRTLWERFFSWPWKPWRKEKTIKEPSRTIYKTEIKGRESFIMHPTMAKELRSALEEQGRTE